MTAGLKAYHLFYPTPGGESPLLSPRWQWLGIITELLLGIWLLSGGWVASAWLAATAFFTLLTGISFYLVWIGQSNCGCFGPVAVHPAVTFGIDLAVLLALLLFRPRPRTCHLTADFRSFLPLLRPVLAILAIPVLLSVLIWLCLTDPPSLLAQLRGEAITVEPALADLGAATAGTRVSFTVRLINHTDHPIRIVGGTTTCACVTTAQLPITLPPRADHSIEIQVVFSGSPGRFQHRYWLYTDNPRQRVVVARFGGTVLAPPPPQTTAVPRAKTWSSGFIPTYTAGASASELLQKNAIRLLTFQLHREDSGLPGTFLRSGEPVADATNLDRPSSPLVTTPRWGCVEGQRFGSWVVVTVGGM